MVTENETYRNFCPVCGYESKEVTARLRREDMEKHRESLHPISDDASPSKGRFLESAGIIQRDSGSEAPIQADEVESSTATDVHRATETSDPASENADLDYPSSEGVGVEANSEAPVQGTVAVEQHESEEIISDSLNDDTETDLLEDGNAEELEADSDLVSDNELDLDSEEMTPVDFVSEPTVPDTELDEPEAPLSFGLSPSSLDNENLLISPWAVFCVGIGECGTKLSATMNTKPRDFVSRHPVFYPVHSTCFDSHASITATLDDERWKTDVRLKMYPVATPQLTPSAPGIGADPNLRSFFSQAGGIGGLPYFGYLAFQQMFGNSNNKFSNYLSRIEDEYFNAQLWENVQTSGILDQSAQVGGKISSVGLITFNSARGGTGSGGTPVVHRFFSEKCQQHELNLALALNVSVLPTESEKATKPHFAKHAVACFYRLRNLTEVHGVIIASNEHLETALNAGSFPEINSTIHEMLAPFVVSPTAKYTFSSGTPSIDQNDMRRTIWNEVSADEKWPGLCTIGMAERPLSDFEFDERGEAVNYERLLEELIERANDLTTCEWQTRHGMSRYVAFLIAPGKVFGRRPFGFSRTVQNKILMESELRLDPSSRVSSGARLGGTSRQERNAMLGYTSLLNLDNSDTVKIVILYANVRVRAVDELFEEALGRELTTGQDGWDEIGQLSQAQVDELEIEQLSNDMTRESAQSLVNSNAIGRPYPFQR